MLTPILNFSKRVESLSRPWIGTVGRFGYTVKGIVYSLVGILGSRSLHGLAAQDAESSGAIETIGEWPLGKYYVAVVGIGLLSYSVWRFLQTVISTDEGWDWHAWLKRIGYFGSGLFYCALAIWAGMYLFAPDYAGGSEHLIEDIMDWPLGFLLIYLCVLVQAAVALQHLAMAITASFMEEYEGLTLRSQRFFCEWLGRYGMAARAMVFAMVGVSLFEAMRLYRADDVGGLEEAIQNVARDSVGWWFLELVSLGMIAYGLYCFTRAGFKRFKK